MPIDPFPDAAIEHHMGATGHDLAQDHFLLTRQLRDYLTMLVRLDREPVIAHAA
jgi:hypothetical protein